MTYTLEALGWSGHFERQLESESPGTPFRISEIHRDRLDGLGAGGIESLTSAHMSTGDYAVGDWVLADDQNRVQTLLERQTLIHRRAAGTDARVQLIAANVDTLFIVSSCNADFNVARLERYLALAHEAGCFPVIVLTKPDTCPDPQDYAGQAQKLDPATPVLVVNALDPAQAADLAEWCLAGQTSALVGSSGVGKTTLSNALTGGDDATRGIREDDAKGRHVTTTRALHPMLNGGWIIDTPGMRALRLEDASEGIEALFDDIAELSVQCRFSDCAHRTEPGCAVLAAVADGSVDPDRVKRWQKLLEEDIRNSRSIAQNRAQSRAFGRMVHNALKDADKRKGR